MRNVVKKFIKTLLIQGSSYHFALAVVIGLGFSESVVLTTIGIMDGFEKTLKKGLKSSMGDIRLRHKQGLFLFDATLKEKLKTQDISTLTGVMESEGFSLRDEKSKGVLIRGIEPKSFRETTGIEIPLNQGEIVIGRELANFFRLKKGDTLILSLMGGGRDVGDIPTLGKFNVGGIIEHGIYEKDLRYIYMHRGELQRIVGVGNLVNNVFLKSRDDDIEKLMDQLKNTLGRNFHILPFWSEFSILLRAVRVEKFMIGLILQVIVIIATLNVLAYIFFLNERRAREIFLFRALGMSQKLMIQSWYALTGLLWVGSCLVAVLFYHMMKYAIEHFSFLSLPSDVYYLAHLTLFLSPQDYGLVFVLSLVWMVLITSLNFQKMKKNTVIEGLKKEFA